MLAIQDQVSYGFRQSLGVNVGVVQRLDYGSFL